MADDAIIQAYWQAYLDTLPADHPHHEAAYTAWGFGDSAQMRDELGALVVQGIKQATASLYWEYLYEGEQLPAVGDISVILDGDEKPMCIIQTTEIRVVPFNEVDEQFAYDEGEGDRSLRYWREAHHAFFSRSCEDIGRDFADDMPVVCERFKLVYQG